jgi:hypothetical protein
MLAAKRSMMLRNSNLRALAGALLWSGFLIGCAASPALAETLEWTRQFGSSSTEYSTRPSADGLGNVYVSGRTLGSLDGPSAGNFDAYVARYDAAGNLQWIQQFGTSVADQGNSVSADGLGNVYISGSTDGSLFGPHAGGVDAFVSKYDAAGNLLWTKQLGTSGNDYGDRVSADGLGNVYVSGATEGILGGPNAGGDDMYVAKYDAAANLQWTKQLGTSGNDFGYGVSADGLGNVYISGITQGSLGGPNAGDYDAFVVKYDVAGNLQWTKQFGTSARDQVNGVSADALGNVYISGWTLGDLGGTNAGFEDAYLVKYDSAGNLQWTRQLGSSASDGNNDVSADGLGNAYISGPTRGSLGGTNTGGVDVYLANYDMVGDLLWTSQLGTSSDDWGGGVSADGQGNVYISGDTWGNLGGASAGQGDVFLAKYADKLAGNFNSDSEVDAADFVVWRDGLGTTYTEADYNMWRANFGATAAEPAAVGRLPLESSVPEPSGLMLAGLTLAFVTWFYRGVRFC